MIQKKQRPQPEEVSLGVAGRRNRTGMGASPVHARRMIQGAIGERAGEREAAEETRRLYMDEAGPIGTVPRPTTLAGAAKAVVQAITGTRAAVLVDRLAERLTSERTSARLYEALIRKLRASGDFDGGPALADLQRFHQQELRHFLLLKECMEQLGADPTALTPSADVAAVESSGVLAVLNDPRTTFGQALHAMLIAELADDAGWELLTSLSSELGQKDLVERFTAASVDERTHLQSMKRWLSAHTLLAAKAG